MAGMVGAMISRQQHAEAQLDGIGTPVLPNTGAAAIMPRMRVSGHSRPPIQAYSSELVSVSMKGRDQPIMPGMPVKYLRM
jgi:hypothetical protein